MTSAGSEQLIDIQPMAIARDSCLGCDSHLTRRGTYDEFSQTQPITEHVRSHLLLVGNSWPNPAGECTFGAGFLDAGTTSNGSSKVLLTDLLSFHSAPYPFTTLSIVPPLEHVKSMAGS